MISVIIPTLDAQSVLARCFDGLIGAAVRGVVRDVIVADGGSNDDTLVIADAVGAHIVRAGKDRASQLVEGAQAAKCDWLLFLHPETALESGWENEAEAFVARSELERPQAGVFRLAVEDFGMRARLSESVAALRAALLALPSGDQGLLIPRRLYQKVGGYRALAALEDVDIVRRLGRRRLIQLRSRAFIGSDKFRNRKTGAVLLSALKVPSGMVSRFYR